MPWPKTSNGRHHQIIPSKYSLLGAQLAKLARAQKQIWYKLDNFLPLLGFTIFSPSNLEGYNWSCVTNPKYSVPTLRQKTHPDIFIKSSCKNYHKNFYLKSVLYWGFKNQAKIQLFSNFEPLQCASGFLNLNQKFQRQNCSKKIHLSTGFPSK